MILTEGFITYFEGEFPDRFIEERSGSLGQLAQGLDQRR
jgi:hypothetical protein